MNAFQWRALLLVTILVLVSACSKTVMENQTADEPQAEPAVQAETEPPAEQPSPAETSPAEPESDGREAFISTHVYFEFDSAVLKPEAQALLQVKAQWLQDNPGIAAVRIEGHCDERGTEAYNLALGARRAEAVKRYMANLGIEGAKLGTVSYGEERPANPESNEAAWAQNRRANFVINP